MNNNKKIEYKTIKMAMAETVEKADKLINKIKRRPFTKIIKTYLEKGFLVVEFAQYKL